jgi:ElaB/YqjD/DUF883 family membrane-anchored ribosome-binding protein
MDPRHEIDDRSGEHANDSELPLRELFEEWKPELARADRKLRLWIRKNPLAALATATIAGVLLGRLLKR